jgi:hypothetical protein
MLLLLWQACGTPANGEAPTLEMPLSLLSRMEPPSEQWVDSEQWVHPLCGANCESECDSVKDHFSTSITELTGLSMPYWRRSNGPSLSTPDASVTTGLIVLHGVQREGEGYLCAMHAGVRKRLVTDEAVRQVLFVSPNVYLPEDSPAPNELYWDTYAWDRGDDSTADAEKSLSLFRVLDEMVQAMMDKDSYPKLTRVVLIGHSAGGKSLQRLALSSTLVPRPGVTISYFVANPGSVAYLAPVRPNLIDRSSACDATKILSHTWSFSVPVPIGGCDVDSVYNDWPGGLEPRANTPPYIAARPAGEMRRAFLARNVTYLSSSEDVCPCIESPDGTNCTSLPSGLVRDQCSLEGSCHMEIIHAFAQHVRQVHNQMAAAGTCEFCKDRPPSHRLVPVSGVNHDGCKLLQADETLAAMFPDAPGNRQHLVPLSAGGTDSAEHAR